MSLWAIRIGQASISIPIMSTTLSGGTAGSGGKVSVAFTCQRCMLPIKLDHTFASIDEHTLAELHCKYCKVIIIECHLTASCLFHSTNRTGFYYQIQLILLHNRKDLSLLYIFLILFLHTLYCYKGTYFYSLIH